MFAFLRKGPRTPPPAQGPARRTLAIDYFREPDSPAPSNPEPAIRPADYFDPSTQRFRPLLPTELVNAHFDLVQQIYESSGMTRQEFRRRFYPLLEFAAAAYQLVPASASHHHREPGGLFLHSMQVCRNAVHLGQFARFERDRSRPVSPADQKLWSVALGVAALSHDAGKLLTDFRVVHPSFFTPGRLLPRLDDGPPPEDEPALFIPYSDTIFQWLYRRNYQEYQIRWLNNDRFARHPRLTQSLLPYWTTALTLQWLPEKIRFTLASIDPPEGSIEADFWDIIRKADQRSTVQYFPAVSGNASSIIGDTLRRLVREGRWRPSPDAFPLRIGPNQRLLLLAPHDLTQLAGHIKGHPQAYALTATGHLPTDQLAALLKFECLIEVDADGQVLFNSSVAGAALPPNQSILILNEGLSRELVDLARSAPPAAAVPTPANGTPPAAASQPPTFAAPPPAQSLDLTRLADPIPPASPSTGSVTPAQAPTSSASVAPAAPIELPELIVAFLEYVESLNVYAIRMADMSGQPRPKDLVSPEHLRIDLQLKSGILLGRPLIQRFAKTHAYPLDRVFQALIGCPHVIARTEPLPPQPTRWLTMTLPASKAVYNQTVEVFATAVDEPGRLPAVPAPPARAVTRSTAPRAEPRQDPPDFTGALQQLNGVPPTVERASAQVSDLRELLWRVLAYPSVSSHFGGSSTIRPLFVGFDLLGKVLEKARLDGIAEAAALDPPVLAERLLASGVPFVIQHDGIFLTDQIEPFWRAFRSGVPLP